MRGLFLTIFAASLLLLTPPAPAVPRAQDCGQLAQSRKFDEYGVVSDAEEKTRLRKLTDALDKEPEDTVAFVIGYAGRAGRAGEGLARADRVRKTVTDGSLTDGSYRSALYNSRINTLDCGRREAPSTELWITPAGASPPRCSPTLDPAPAPAKGGGAQGRPRRRSGRP